eukprot:tig00000670_g3018.t1
MEVDHLTFEALAESIAGAAVPVGGERAWKPKARDIDPSQLQQENGGGATRTDGAPRNPCNCDDRGCEDVAAISNAEALRWARRDRSRESALWRGSGDVPRTVLSALDSTHEGVAIANEEGNKLIYGNASYERLTGFRFHEVVGMLCPILGCVQAGSKTHSDLVAALTAGRCEELEFAARRRDGTPWVANVHLQPVRCPSTGKITNWLGLVRDVTAPRVAEAAQAAARAALIDANEKAGRAEAASQAKSSWVSYTSHELRTPLHGLIAGTQLLLESRPLTEDQRELASGICFSGQSMLDFIGDALDFAKIEAGKLQLGSAPFGLRACIDAALSASSARAHVGVHLACSVTVDEALGSGRPVGDETKLRQVLNNFTSNALKFTDKGAVIVRCRAVKGDATHDAGMGKGGPASAACGALLEFEVEDTGCGIAKEDLGRLFASFVQVGDSNGKRNCNMGTGLGLCIAKAIVEAMHGELGVGTKVSFSVRLGWMADQTLASSRNATASRAPAPVSSNLRRAALYPGLSAAVIPALRNILDHLSVEMVALPAPGEEQAAASSDRDRESAPCDYLIVPLRTCCSLLKAEETEQSALALLEQFLPAR